MKITVEQKIKQSKLFLSEKDFSLLQIEKELGIKKESIQRGLAGLLRHGELFTEYGNNRRLYRKAVRHWVHTMPLAKYTPPLAVKDLHLSPWLTRERYDDFK